MRNRNVLVCSLGDLFGEWFESDVIREILKEVEQKKQLNFIFLTKYPQRLTEFNWPQNAWVGTTVDKQERVREAEEAFKKVKASVTFVSCEPLLEELTFERLHLFKWIIIGAQRKTREVKALQPKWQWVENLLFKARDANLKVYITPKLREWPREYPSYDQDQKAELMTTQRPESPRHEREVHDTSPYPTAVSLKGSDGGEVCVMLPSKQATREQSPSDAGSVQQANPAHSNAEPKPSLLVGPGENASIEEHENTTGKKATADEKTQGVHKLEVAGPTQRSLGPLFGPDPTPTQIKTARNVPSLNSILVSKELAVKADERP